jgi:hypothetical protein
MFVSLLLVTLVLAAVCSFVIARVFRGPIDRTLDRIVGAEFGAAWKRYLTFAIYVVGISGGVRVWDLEKYITPAPDNPIVLNSDRWILELYRTLIGTMQGVAWMLLVFFAFALVAYVIVRRGERPAAES